MITNSLLTLEGLEEERHLLEIDKCRADPVYFISNYLKIAEPRNVLGGIDIIPFRLWPYQIEYIRLLDKQLREGRGLTAKKCRDMGITLTTLAHFFYHWRFTRGYSALVGSLNEKEVRKLEGDTDPLFSKLDIFIKNLPDWLLPQGFVYEVHSLGMSLINPELGTSIIGSPMGKNFGLSKRKTEILIDEDAQLLYDVGGQCEQSSNTVIRVSTVNIGHFRSVCERAAKAGELIEYPWYLNPNHTPEWYARQKAKLLPWEFARFIEMDFDASVADRVYDIFDDCPISEEYDYRDDLPLATAWDFGLADPTAILFIQEDLTTGEVFVIDEFEKTQSDILFFTQFIPGAKPLIPNPYPLTKEEQEIVDRHYLWKRPIRNFGDKSGKAHKSQVVRVSEWEALKEYDIRMELEDQYYYQMYQRIRQTYQGLKRLKVHPRCKKFIRAMKSYHYEPLPLANASQGITPAQRSPEHDASSHFATALEFFFISEARMKHDPTAPRKPVRARAHNSKFSYSKWAS
jgi:hypothetical protein